MTWLLWLAFDACLFLLEVAADTREDRPYVFRPSRFEGWLTAKVDAVIEWAEDTMPGWGGQ